MSLRRERNRDVHGFTLIELMMVMAIMLVIAAFATPYMVNVIANVRLRGSMVSLAGVFQECRSQSIKQNQLMITHFSTLANGPVAFLKDPTAGSQSLLSTDFQAELGAPITYVPSLTGVTGAPTALSSTNLCNVTTILTGTDSAFNPRGLPCQYVSASNCSTGSYFVYYFSDTRPLGKNGWGAVSISPAGRIKVWIWSGSGWTN